MGEDHYAFGPLAMPLRVLLFVLCVLLIAPGLATDIAGLVGISIILGYQFLKIRGRSATSMVDS